MTALPIIVGMGGINASGRTSFHQGFRRIVVDKLTEQARQETYLGLATLMNLVRFEEGKLLDNDNNEVEAEAIESLFGEQILAGTLIRRIEKNFFDVEATHAHQKMTLTPSDGDITFETTKKQLPNPIPGTWQVTELADGKVKVAVAESLVIKHDTYRNNPIKAAGQFPTGFAPEKMYNSRYQPRGLVATVFAATDAIRSTGIAWDDVLTKISPDLVGVYSSSVAGQMQSEGFGGLLKNRLYGERVTTKNLALGLNTMPTDFINAYVTGNVGTTFTASGACATFLYNLRAALQDIQSGRVRLAIAGSTEAAITPEIVEGFCNMSALANEENLKKLDGTDTADHRRTSRPFGKNCGFTVGEGAQYVVLMDDELALEMGAKVMGSVADIFINADGVKKSITAPGPGNYITMAKSVALAKSILGEESVKERSFILAHGSSTPANRVTESLIYHKVAQAFDINNWPVAAPKAFVGHTVGPASGDQMAMALGVFEHNIMPGVTTIDAVAPDVYDEHLNIALDHWQCPDMDIAFINSKGFGGNNATATVLSPTITMQMLTKRHGEEAMASYQDKLVNVSHAQAEYQKQANLGQYDLIYKFGDGLIDEESIEIDQEFLSLKEFEHKITLPNQNPFADMT